MVSDHKDRFVALTSVSLQFPDLAAEQLDYGVKQLGLRGATIGGHVNGESLSDPKFDPFWAKANELGVIVFMHPGGADNIVKDDAWKARGDIGNIIGNPLETTYFLTRLIFDGTFDKFPNLKVCGAHGGGYLPSYFQRTEVACDVRGNAMCANKKHPREYLEDQHHGRHDGADRRGAAASRRRDGHQPGGLRHGQPAQLAGAGRDDRRTTRR